MLLDERNDIIHLLLRWLEATFPILRDNELITTHPSETDDTGKAEAIDKAIAIGNFLPKT